MIELALKFSDFIWFLLIPLLLFTGIVFAFRTRLVQLNINNMFSALFTKKADSNSISGLQAFFVGLASRVGTGNIAGVAIAIASGGPGSVFWMWIVAILGAASAFIESTLAQLYKVKDEETKYRGGPAYYIRYGLNSKFFSMLFAILITLAFGLIFNGVQANTISGSLTMFAPDNLLETINIFGMTFVKFNFIVAIILGLLVGIILFKGAKTIANLSSVIVPIMASLYIVLVVIVLLTNVTQIPAMFSLIFTEAFSPHAFVGGMTGSTVVLGVKRGLFSNEAGMGSAPNAAATADVEHPVTQGYIQALGVYVDTLLVCTGTALVILISGYDYQAAMANGIEGIEITQNSIIAVLGNFSVIFLTIAIFFFAFSSILGNYFYSQSNIEYIHNSKSFINAFKLLVVFMVMFGALVNASTVWALADLFMGMMAIVNIGAILLLHNKAILLLKDHTLQKKKGINTPVFKASDHEEFKDFEIWS